MNNRTATRVVATAAALLMTTLGASACGSDSSDADSDEDRDGEYVGEASSNGYLPTIVVDGKTVIYNEVGCDGGNDDTSVGELDDDASTVVWVEEGRFKGDDQISFTDSALVVGSNSGDSSDEDDTFSREGTPQADEQSAEHRASCEEKAAPDAEDEPTEGETDAAVREAEFDAMTDEEIAECAGTDAATIAQYRRDPAGWEQFRSGVIAECVGE
jgi:hypothetical protein